MLQYEPCSWAAAVGSFLFKRNICLTWKQQNNQQLVFHGYLHPHAQCARAGVKAHPVTHIPYWTQKAPVWFSPSEGHCPAAWTEISSSCMPESGSKPRPVNHARVWISAKPVPMRTRPRFTQQQLIQAARLLGCVDAAWARGKFTGINERTANQRARRPDPTVRPRPQCVIKTRAGSVRTGFSLNTY